jgi:hypothetical protein
VRAKRHYSCCGEVGHNSRTCKVEIEDIDNSEESEEWYPIAFIKKKCCGVARRRRAGASPGVRGALAWVGRSHGKHVT